MELSEIKDFFKDRKLPDAMTVKGMVYKNVRAMVDAHIAYCENMEAKTAAPYMGRLIMIKNRIEGKK